MRTPTTEVLDLALTQTIESYRDMDPDDVYDAIAAEWPEQMAILLIEFLFKTRCARCGDTPSFIDIQRENGACHYIVPLCSCKTRIPFVPLPDGDNGYESDDTNDAWR